jgi:hypothetical protein
VSRHPIQPEIDYLLKVFLRAATVGCPVALEISLFGDGPYGPTKEYVNGDYRS